MERNSYISGTLQLQKLIDQKKGDIGFLKIKKNRILDNTARYSKLFNKSHISLWEENPAKAYKILDTLPCSNGSEISDFLTKNIPVLIQLIQNLVIVDVNDFTVLLFGAKTKLDFLNILEGGNIITPESFKGFISIFAAMKEGIPSCQEEISPITVDGRELNLLMTAFIPPSRKDNILVTMMDISKRKHNEENLIKAVALAEEQKTRTLTLQNILFHLCSSLNRDEILNAILKEVKNIIPYSCANIKLLENGYLKVVSETGYDKFEAGNFIRKSYFKVTELGDTDFHLKHGTISIIPDTRKYPNWRIFKETEFILGFIGIPLFSKNNIAMGLLALESDTAGLFSESDIEKLLPFAHAASVALQSSLLFDKTKEEMKKHERIENSLEKSLREKEILLREIHHRVKNNLGLIMSLINLQGSMLKNNINPFIFEDLKQRVYTISLVHERLYSGRNLSSIDLRSYLLDLTASIQSSAIFMNGIVFELNIEEDIEIKPDTLVPLALLLNELIINSVKYAFTDTPGIISITLNKTGKNNQIIFRDNGIGFPETRVHSQEQIGIDLVESLAAQIGGSADFMTDNGAVIKITFQN